MTTIMKSSQTRVFTIEGRARGDHEPIYQSCLRAGAASQGFGDVERIECPDPFSYDGFVEVGEIQGAIERATTSLEGRYALDEVSDLLRIAAKRCALDLQVHMGACKDPSDFNSFDKALIFEGAKLTNFSTEDLGVLSSGDTAAINESADVSAKSIYEVVPIGFSSKAGTIVTNEVVDVVICDVKACGECSSDDSNGCEKIFAITKGAGGSPTTPPDVVFTVDGGVTFYAHDIDSMSTAEDPSAIACVKTNVVVVSNQTNTLHYTPKTDLDGVHDPSWTEVATGFVVDGEPNDIWSVGNYAFIVGDNGYVYGLSDAADGVEVLDAGSATVDVLYAVHALSETFAVAVGASGAVIFTTDGVTWQAAAIRPVGVGINLNCVWAKSESEWWVGTSNGRLYYTLNSGSSWTLKAFSGSNAGQVYDIQFASPTIGYMSHASATPRGRMFRTFDGGYSWVLLPEDTNKAMPLTDRFNAISACTADPNFVIGVGLNDNGTDGVIVLGSK